MLRFVSARSFATLLVLALLSLPVQSAESVLQPGDTVLLNANAYRLEPIAIRTKANIWRELPTENQTPEIMDVVKRLFSPGKLLPVYRNGLDQGVFKIKGYNPPGCAGFGILDGQRNPLPQDELYDSGLAFSDDFPILRNTSLQGNDVTKLKTEASVLTRNQYLKHNLPAVDLSRVQLQDTQSLRLGSGKVNALAITSRIPSREPETDPCDTNTLFTLAELQDGKYVPKLELYKEATQKEGGCSGYRLISTFRMANDPADYIVLEGYGYEWNWYEIYRRKPDGGYDLMFNGGGGGC